MAKEIKLPELGENITNASIVNVLVKAGDVVEADQPIIEIETDKATIEVPTTEAGKVSKVNVKSGDKIDVGAVILELEGDGASDGKSNVEQAEMKKEVAPEDSNIAAKDSKKEDPKKEETKAKVEVKQEQMEEKTSGKDVEIVLPELGENITSASIVNVLVKTGDMIEKDQAILEIETDKATIEVPSTVAGKVTEVFVKAGGKAEVGSPIIKVTSSEKISSTQPKKLEGEKKDEKELSKKDSMPEESSMVKEEPSKGEDKFKAEQDRETHGKRENLEPGEMDKQPPIKKGSAPAAPSVRRIAREIGVNIDEVQGSGPGGRISMDDVKAYAKKLLAQQKQAPAGASAPEGAFFVKKEKLPDFSKFGETDPQPMNNIRIKVSEHLGYAWASIPHVTQHDKADITVLEEVRKKLSKKVEKSGTKLTVTAILVKIIENGLKKYPQFNASIDLEKQQIIFKKYFNVGIAVDTENGLIVPVIKNVDKKNLTEIAVEMNQLAEKARSKKIGLDDLQGGCISISNLGGIGGTYFTPVVNTPEVAILGVSRSVMEPVYIDGKFEPRMMLPLSLSYDHRVIDGADAARFLRFVCEALEDPISMML